MVVSIWRLPWITKTWAKTMSKSHNKKRNVGIIYEQLLRTMSSALVDGDNKKYNDVLGIVKKHFATDTQLYREFRLFNALVKTSVDKESLATRILEEAKTAARSFDHAQLRREKAALIKDINHTLNDVRFYSQRIDEYRSYATIQTLLNDWRSPGQPNLGRIAKYENQVCNRLLAEKHEPALSQHHSDDVSNLTVKIMTEKFNLKYGRQLNDEQTGLIKEYVFSEAAGNNREFKGYRDELKTSLIAEIDIFSESCSNDILNEKINIVRESVGSLAVKEIDDTTISRFLLISQLKRELLESDDE